MDNYQQGVNQQATGDNGNVQNQNGNTGADNGSGDSNRARNGLWINQLPKALRSSFDGEDMPTIGDLARDYLRLKELKEGTEGNQNDGKPARKHAEESYSDVSKYFSSGDDFNSRIEQKLFSLLKDSDADPSKIAEIFAMKPDDNDIKSAAKKATDARNGSLKKMWDKSYDENMKVYERAMNELDENTRNEMTRSGDIYSPFVADLLVKYANATRHGSEPGSAHAGQEPLTIREIMGWTD